MKTDLTPAQKIRLEELNRFAEHINGVVLDGEVLRTLGQYVIQRVKEILRDE